MAKPGGRWIGFGGGARPGKDEAGAEIGSGIAVGAGGSETRFLLPIRRVHEELRDNNEKITTQVDNHFPGMGRFCDFTDSMA